MCSIHSSSSVIQSEELYLANSKFEFYDDLLKSVRDFYYAKGYALKIRDSRKDKYVILQCDRAGLYQDTLGDKRKKNTGSRLNDCTFQISGKKGSDGLWIFKAKNLAHTHPPSTDMSGHPSCRRLKSEDIQTVKNMTLSGIPPRQVLSSLRQQSPNLPATSRTIYNLKAKIRKDSLGNRPMINVLFEELQKGGFSYDVLHNPEGRITHLFMAHPLSVKLAKIFSNIFVMDCTYKTNIYKMPLLDIIGVTCFNTTFYSGFAFLEKEGEEDYVWALNAFKKIVGHENQPSVIMTDRELALINGIKNVFASTTSLLCVWHIEKNVVANCKKYFGRSEDFDIFLSSWNNIAYSSTEALFEKNWGDFKLFYREQKDAIGYLNKTWLPWKEKFVSAWTDKYLHFGNRSSSRVEGAHSKLKKYLQVSTGDLKEVKDKICLAVEHEFNEIKVKLESEKIRVPHNCNMPVFRELLCNVSKFALNEIYMQYERIKNGTMTFCTSHFMTTMGLPCAHRIQSLKGMTLPLDLVHPQWRIDTLSLNLEDDLHNNDEENFLKLVNEMTEKYKTWSLSKKELATSTITKLVIESDMLFEPMIRRPKGRPPKAKKQRGTTSTRRDPSRFEHVESSQAHNPSSSTQEFWSNNEVFRGASYVHHDIGLIDLNFCPDFSDAFPSFK